MESKGPKNMHCGSARNESDIAMAKEDEVVEFNDGDKDIGTEKDKEKKNLKKAGAKGAGEKRKRGESKLKTRLEEYEETKTTLEQSLNEKNEEIAELQRSVHSLNELLNSLPIEEMRSNSSVASNKLLELSDANRHLRQELEAAKNQISKKELRYEKLKRELQLKTDQHTKDMEVRKKRQHSPSNELERKYKDLKQKYGEISEKNTQLQKELKSIQQCLEAELGESVNISILASQQAHSQGWRGRAQQILHLQQQIQELRAQLEQYEQGSVQPSSTELWSEETPSYNTSDGNVEINVPNSGISFVDSYQNGVRKDELVCRAKIDELEKKLTHLQKLSEAESSRILALRVRNKTLYDDLLKLKAKNRQHLDQKGQQGLELASMREKINISRVQQEAYLEVKQRELARLQQQSEAAMLQEEEARTQYENMFGVLEAREAQIKELKESIAKMETHMKEDCGEFVYTCKEFTKEELIGLLDVLEARNNLLETYEEVLLKRVRKEDDIGAQLRETLAQKKIRSARLQARVRELAKESQLQEARKKRTKRISAYSRQISASSSSTSHSGENADNISSYSQETDGEINDLNDILKIATHKVLRLEERLTCLTYEKVIDTETFNDIECLIKNASNHKQLENND